MKNIMLLSFVSLISLSFECAAMEPEILKEDGKVLKRSECSESSASESEGRDSFVVLVKSKRRVRGKGHLNKNSKSKPIKDNKCLQPEDISKILKNGSSEGE
jgi:hypothetical protein